MRVGECNIVLAGYYLPRAIKHRARKHSTVEPECRKRLADARYRAFCPKFKDALLCSVPTLFGRVTPFWIVSLASCIRDAHLLRSHLDMRRVHRALKSKLSVMRSLRQALRALAPSRRLGGVLLGALLVGMACSGEPESIWTGSMLEYNASPGHQVCAGTYEHLDSYLEYLVEYLGILPTSGTRIRYSWLDRDELDERCGAEHSGCADALESAGERAIHYHELVHNVLHLVNGHEAHWLFNEGIAEALDPEFFLSNQDHLVHDPRDFIPVEHDVSLGYDTAGEFVVYLLYRFGPDAYARFLVEGNPQDELAKIRTTFQAIYSESFDTVVEEFIEERSCLADGYPVVPYFCSATEVPWAGETWRYTATLACDSEMVLGGDNDRVSVVTLEISEPGNYVIESSGAVVVVGSCSGCPWDASTPVADGRLVEVALDRGRRFVHVDGNDDVSVTISRRPD